MVHLGVKRKENIKMRAVNIYILAREQAQMYSDVFNSQQGKKSLVGLFTVLAQ